MSCVVLKHIAVTYPPSTDTAPLPESVNNILPHGQMLPLGSIICLSSIVRWVAGCQEHKQLLAQVTDCWNLKASHHQLCHPQAPLLKALCLYLTRTFGISKTPTTLWHPPMIIHANPWHSLRALAPLNKSILGQPTCWLKQHYCMPGRWLVQVSWSGRYVI